MSRSYRKPWVKDPANRYMKKIFSRMYRSRCRQIMRVYADGISNIDYWKAEDPQFPSKHQVLDQYDIYDFSFRIHKQSFGYRMTEGFLWAGQMEDNMKQYQRACRK